MFIIDDWCTWGVPPSRARVEIEEDASRKRGKGVVNVEGRWSGGGGSHQKNGGAFHAGG